MPTQAAKTNPESVRSQCCLKSLWTEYTFLYEEELTT